ncbi:TetR/AcrR family transcriptional regulator [Frankia sp. CNm7]|uniref:TetR/AcrR family transcriptional regulator n=1 Tax=Frankia nepalensis TaxID=1836974 RepID=A0A937UMY7_9ACTN|nr:TetR/AcrR family transcriptional regulator [Frankia nepalensis]MBL7496565.1 TetR/AcrR family transcriptional regulator [Frankia nepalensis]MBL7508784.1 TetR/AcrR family transcriptional regulator [Frankia nepalensis]MBL7520589.1 TetR/AcrR family transcriptional regulator [Frankia nepalensis]MBL7627538.1 TetR/AcrR family transcriptional regulator [Frankia nepalensis]
METRAQLARTAIVVDLPTGLHRAGEPLSSTRQRTRERLLTAARVVFERDGFDNSRVTDISRLSGLAHGGFYRYFESKEAAFVELATAAHERLGTPLDGVSFEPDSLDELPERLRASIRRYLAAYGAEARILGLVGEVRRQDDQLLALRSACQRPDIARHVEPVRQSQRLELLEPRVNPEALLFAVVGMVERFAEQWLVRAAVACDLETAATQLARLCLQAMRPAWRCPPAAAAWA